MIPQIYVEEHDRLLVKHDGGDRFSVEVDPGVGVPFRMLLSMTQLQVLRANICDAMLRRLEPRQPVAEAVVDGVGWDGRIDDDKTVCGLQVRLAKEAVEEWDGQDDQDLVLLLREKFRREVRGSDQCTSRAPAEAVVDADDLLHAMAEGFEPRMADHD